MMDLTLRCNILTCRKILDHQAVVTNCSHIFCLDCANSFIGSPNSNGGTRVCPACETQLGNEFDISVNLLNPCDEYKSSVLSGLHPTIILETTGRAMSFWAYQMQQEIVYQEYLGNSLRERFNGLSAQLDNVIHDANNEVANLQNRVKALTIENESMNKKNHELAEALREKSRKHLQVQEQYDKLRRKTLIYSNAQEAANVIERTLNNQVPMTPQHQPAAFAAATPGPQQNSGGGVSLGSETMRRGRVSLPNFVTQGGGIGTTRSPEIGATRSNMGPPPFIPSRDANNTSSNASSWANVNATPLRRPHLQGQTLTNSIHGRSDNQQHRPTLGLISQGNLNSIANSNPYGSGIKRHDAGMHGGLLANAARSSARHYTNDLHISQNMARGYSADTGNRLD